MSKSPDNNAEPIDFCTLGMFIIDEIHYSQSSGREPVFNILGGAGSYSALGARLFSPSPLESKRVGWIVDEGSDFPAEVRDTIAAWDTGVLIRQTPERLTTRGWNGYTADEQRAFKYLTPKLRLHDGSLTPRLLRSKSFHLICSPSRCIELVNGILKRLEHLASDNDEILPQPRPLFIWEPVPDLCVPGELSACYEALRHVDIVSPNHTELCSFFGRSGNDENGDAKRNEIQSCCEDWLKSGVGAHGEGAVVIRVGKDGCFVAARDDTQWLPAYYEENSQKVVDPTGGGNTFLGAFAVGLVRTKQASRMKKLVEAVMWGSVAASFAIEQVGVPLLEIKGDGETWNGERVLDRLESFRTRVDTSLQV